MTRVTNVGSSCRSIIIPLGDDDAPIEADATPIADNATILLNGAVLADGFTYVVSDWVVGYAVQFDYEMQAGDTLTIIQPVIVDGVIKYWVESWSIISNAVASIAWAGTRRQSDSVIETVTGFAGILRVFVNDVTGNPVDLSAVTNLKFSVAHKAKTPTPMTNLDAIGGVGYFDVVVTAIADADSYVWSIRGDGLVPYKGQYLVEWAP